jgi:hypothetical protein
MSASSAAVSDRDIFENELDLKFAASKLSLLLVYEMYDDFISWLSEIT